MSKAAQTDALYLLSLRSTRRNYKKFINYLEKQIAIYEKRMAQHRKARK